MGLSEIAAGIEVTDEQRDRGVAAVDRTEATLAERLASVADDLPCPPDAAATVVEAYADGTSVGAAGRAAGVAPVTAAKTLHLVGEQVSPVGPVGREIVADWLAGECSRTEAERLAGVGERTFALAAYVQTHDPLPAAREAVEGVLSDRDATADREASLGDTLATPADR